ncbi:HlyD family efflux transporter periplasmic adaptor subunit [Paenactinomyces guangxiensis]|uniref:Efflux RND transporter periplasmic adaptor subunit n=1 Tax=Paenactinomyces guangxiensis TaxID=1490290 RepID=A0A7W2A7U1_9BACL|nr:HlyD family efflux transporter periplasmic adaptor subunit [Paenactinomyces guangxiensis]MBA4493955.1 efflux RND transporter periplasmic adaptor subunit [Paenactinomyces guangxiensis]MBH8591422.1 efflux RND transporter periplasmic adaptor subunit [Paenactinomyces guangxiensis]
MKTGRFLLLNTLIFIVIVALGIGGYYYYFNQSNYIDTEDAKVAGDVIPVSADSAGKLTEWKGQTGTVLKQGEMVGKVAVGTETKNITVPVSGTIVQSKVNEGQMVAPGQPLAQVVDMDKLYILANIEETDIKDVSVGQEVDITVDAQSDTKIKGKVTQMGLATNSVFSLLPQQNASGNYTKVVQRIPVKIEMESYPNGIVPGMNATIRIHK